METAEGTAVAPVEEEEKQNAGEAGQAAPAGREGLSGSATAGEEKREERGHDLGQENRRLPTKIQQGLEKLEWAKGWVLGEGGGRGGGSPSVGNVSIMLAVRYMQVFFVW